MRIWMLQMLLASAVAISGSAEAGGSKLGGRELYPWDVVKMPGISAAWRSAVAKAKVPRQEQFWVQDMNGPSSALVATVVGERELYVGHTCRPHDCYDNNLVFAVDLANKQIWGLRQGRGQSPEAKQFIGAPAREMRDFLLRTMAAEFPANP